MGGVQCCQNEVYREQFKEYCLDVSASEYKAYFASIQHEEYNASPQLKTQKKLYKYGSWKKGQVQTGKGVIFSPEKFYYEGQIVDGEAKGEGKIIWPNKYFYKGSVIANKAEGLGEMHLGDRSLVLKGHWQNGYPRVNEKIDLSRAGKQGSISFIDYSGAKIEDYFKEDLRVRIDFGNGVIYTGDVKHKNHIYRIQGTGNMTFSNGSHYIGQFKAGKMHGKGRYTWAQTGHWFEGNYKDNLREGTGTYYYNINQFETGEWRGGILFKRKHGSSLQAQNPQKQEKTVPN